ncbi:MAG: acyltransferase [Glaciimonas sp.]|nr:acyltransferase [Glaciimonas sp.]
MPASQTMKKQYFEQLTWLRGIAAFFVIVSHTMRSAEVVYGPGDVGGRFLPMNLLDLGTFGVCLFFVLSGCTLYLSNASRVNNLGDVGRFYVKRFLRIWPAFAVSLFLYIVFIEVFAAFYTGNKEYWIAHFLTPYTTGDVLRYLLLVSDYTGPKNIFNAAYWSLPIEFRYYLLLPIVLMLMRRKVVGIGASLFIIGLLYFVLHHPGLIAMDRYEFFQLGFTFFGGVIIAALFDEVRWRMRFSLGFVLFLVCVALVAAIRLDYIALPQEMFFFSDKTNCYGLIAIVATALALYVKPIAIKSWMTDYLYKYGVISYSIYLFHLLFAGIAVLLVMRFHIYGNYPKLVFIFALIFVGSYFAATISYRFFEAPFIALGRKYVYSRRKVRAPTEINVKSTS